MVDREALRQHIRGLYEAGHVRGESGRQIPISPVGVDEVRGEALRDLAVSEGAIRTLETGLGLGLSAIFICEAIVSSGSADACHIAMDPVQDRFWDDAGLRTVRDGGALELLQFHRSPSSLVLPSLISQAMADPELSHRAKRTATVGTIDLAFIDGDHLFESAFIDIYFALSLVKPGRLIVVDDMWMSSVRLAVSYFEKNVGLERLPFPGAPPARKGRRHRDMDKMVMLRRPVEDASMFRPWDHFVPFW